jgi:hypothetical protein
MSTSPVKDNPVFSYAAGLRRAMSAIQWTLIACGMALAITAELLAKAAVLLNAPVGSGPSSTRITGIILLCAGIIFGAAWRRILRNSFRRKFRGPSP